MLKIIIITHGNLAEELLKSAKRVSGEQSDIYAINMSETGSLESLKKKIDIFFNEQDIKDGVLVFTDIIGGTPFNACSGLISMPNVEVVSGINLPMLLSALFNRQTMEISKLADKVCLDGKKTINTMKKLLKNKAES